MHTGRDMLRTILLMILYFMAVLALFVVCLVGSIKLMDYINSQVARFLVFLVIFGVLIWVVRSVSQKVVPKILDKDADDDYPD